jgi:hypothetical protein
MISGDSHETSLPPRPNRGSKHRKQGVERVHTSMWLEPQDHSTLQSFARMAGIPMAHVVEKMIRREARKRERRAMESGITPPISL